MDDAASVATIIRDGRMVWEVTGKPVSVRLSLDVVGRLGMAVREGFKALPRRGLETGGLLIGTRREAGSQVVVDVDDFEAVESEHTAGPSYVLSEADRRRLEARIAARDTAAKAHSVVGFYRSHTRSGFGITAEDVDLFSTYFPKASDVFLLIRSNDGAPPTGGFIIREGGKVLAQSPYVQLPFNQNGAMPPARVIRAAGLPTSPAPAPAAPVVPSRVPQRPVRMVRWPIWLKTAGAVALAVGLSFGIRSRGPGLLPTKASPSLALNVTNPGNGLRLSWDHQTARRANHAVLWIQDGKEEQRVELDSKQLSEGSVAYWPRSSDVNFRLQLLFPGSTVSESVRAIGGPSKPLVGVPAAAGVAAATLPVPAPSPKVPQSSQIEATSRQRSRAFELPRPASDRAAVAGADLPNPPTVQPVVMLPLEHSKEFLEAIVPTYGPGLRDGASSSFRVSVEPVSGSRLEHFAQHLPVVGKRYRRSDYVPPVPLRNPAIPSPMPRNVTHDLNIDIKVYVNPSGKVDYSEVLSKLAVADRDLIAAAMFSARRWEFVPAHAGDDTVPGEVILHYQFGPGAHLTRNSAAAQR